MLVSGHSKELYEFLLQEQGQTIDPGESIPYCIGYIHNNKIVAVAMFENYSGTNIWMHFSVDMPIRKWILAILHHAFVTLDCKIASTFISDNNTKIIKLMEVVGASHEYTLVNGRIGGNSLLYVLRKDTGIHARLSSKLKDFKYD